MTMLLMRGVILKNCK